MASRSEWDGQSDWGPGYDSWWEVCGECEGHYNWFNIEVMEAWFMYGWMHRDSESDCWRAKPMVFSLDK